MGEPLFGFHALAPVTGELAQEPLVITALNSGIQVFKQLHAGGIRRHRVMAIGGIKTVEICLVSVVERLNTLVMKAFGMLVTQAKQRNRRRQCSIQLPVALAAGIVFMPRRPITVQARHNDAVEQLQVAGIRRGNRLAEIDNDLLLHHLKRRHMA